MAETKDAPPANPLMLRITEGKNPRGIPTAKFIVRQEFYRVIFSFTLNSPSIFAYFDLIILFLCF